MVSHRQIEAGAVKWPPGPWAFFVLVAYAAVLLIYVESHGGQDLTFLPNHWAEHMPTRDELHWAFMVRRASSISPLCMAGFSMLPFYLLLLLRV